MQDQLTAGSLLGTIRANPPLVQCITNFVAMNIAANVMLAAGASPAMVHAEEEAGEFAAISGALTITIGTLSAGWLAGMLKAAQSANGAAKPWVLDPVAHYATGFRRKAVAQLLELRPTIIRGNASEIIALAGVMSRGQGVDSRDAVEQAEESARQLAEKHGCVVAVTGVADFVTDGQKAKRIAGGSPFMPQVTALGCPLTCLVGAFAAARPDEPFDATVAALAVFAVAGAQAGAAADGPGSFSWRFLDALAALTPEVLDRDARISVA
ncbi:MULTISPECIES: hydroxyethylthiazole kinase [unclassified Rhizobium]|uniref:hydroxyethylthiazole kinase n=1 Tax=unclassified Rhizobium TaxID=2613769 RepID=UPI000EAA1CAF|nr:MULTISPECIES: hydroxyethylthiazole kinase [unclassified Rhizobium]AYG68914.1 hydroxyethylthiazole kinase [Rhizobium sp. CCGE531]AYG75300.1 hydroxyethylthiazole kinase [Rhizobium sp. CCGE532]